MFLKCIDAGAPFLGMNALAVESIFATTTTPFFNVIRDFAAKSPDRRVVQAVPFEKHSARLVAGQSGHT
jgi:hypothetical protein